MRGDDHERVTLIAIHLVSQNSDSPGVDQLRRIASFVAYFSKLPDVDPERETEGGLRWRRIPHHAYPLNRILQMLLKVRRSVLEGKVGGREAKTLGYALHYLQDRCVPPPHHPQHDKIGRARSASPRSTRLTDVRGLRELRAFLEDQYPAPDTIERAIAASYAALYAVFANPSKPPPEIEAIASRFWRKFRGWRGTIYAQLASAGFALCAYAAVHAPPLAAVLLAVPTATYAVAVAAALSKKRGLALQILDGLASKRLALLNAASAVLALLSLPAQLALPAILPLPAVAAGPLLSKDFREVKREIVWFLWD